MSTQSTRVAALLGARDSNDVRKWLGRLEAVVAQEGQLEPETIADLVARGRPRWGVRSADEAAAFIEFWEATSRRHDTPHLQAAYADVLHLLGGAGRTREALKLFVAAVHREPTLFVEYAGDFADTAEQCDPEAQRDFELAKIAFYGLRVDQGEMEPEELQLAVRALLVQHPNDSELRARLRELAGVSLGALK